MVRFYSSNDTYPYPFPAVTLAYFLRYPNPYSTHVVSTDTIARQFDPVAQTLTTVRLHLKRSKLPSAVLRIVPKSLLGASAAGDTQSYILEKSVVDIKNGRMETESRNLEWTGVLSVIERQGFQRPSAPVSDDSRIFSGMENAARRHGFLSFGPGAKVEDSDEMTEVTSSVTLHSHIGEKWKKSRKEKEDGAGEEKEEKVGFFKSWSTASLQRSIEMIGLKRARRSQPNAKEGMKVVLERMREGGLVAVLEGMRQDRESVMGGHHAISTGPPGRNDEE